MKRQIKQLLKQLQSDSPKERYAAAAELAKLRAVATLPMLDKVATLDENEKVREMAYKAVRFLTILKDEMEDEELRRQIMEIDAADDESDGWSGIESILTTDSHEEVDTDKMKKMKGFSSVFGRGDDEPYSDNFEPEDYDSIELGIPTLSFDDDDDMREDVASVPATGRGKKVRERRINRRGTSALMRIVLWVSVSVAIVGLGVVAQNELLDDSPDDRTETLDGLEAWHEDMLTATNRYFTAAVTAADFDCDAFETSAADFAVPQAPGWAEPDGEFQDGLDDFFVGMEQATENLEFVQRSLQQLCDRIDGTTTLPGGLGTAIQQNLTEALTALNGPVRRNLTEARANT